MSQNLNQLNDRELIHLRDIPSVDGTMFSFVLGFSLFGGFSRVARLKW